MIQRIYHDRRMAQIRKEEAEEGERKAAALKKKSHSVDDTMSSMMDPGYFQQPQRTQCEGKETKTEKETKEKK